MGVVRAARLGRPRREGARRNWPNLACNPVLSIMLRERKGGCPWCSPGGSCHHQRRAAWAARSYVAADRLRSARPWPLILAAACMILCCSSHPSGFSSSTGAFANRKGRAVAAATAPKFAGSAGVKRAPRAVMPLGFRYRRHRARQRVEGRGAGCAAPQGAR